MALLPHYARNLEVEVPDEQARTDLRHLATRLAEDAGRLIVTERPGSLGVAATKSSDADVVTVMDQASEAFLREQIATRRPQDAILGEEDGISGGTSGLTWVIDPIDGTVNYLYSHPFYAVSVAVCVGDVTTDGAWAPIAGAVHAPMLGETYAAAAGLGATLTAADGREQHLHVSNRDEFALALIGTGFGYEADKRAAQGKVVSELLPKVRDIRRGGSAALDLCFVGAGRLDGYYESGINAWDHAAGQLVVTEAGGLLGGTQENGGAPGKSLAVAGAPGVFENLLNFVS